MHDAIHRCGRHDTERKGEHGHGRKAGVLAKLAKSEAKVVKHSGSGLGVRGSCRVIANPGTRISYHGFIHT